MSTTGEKLKQQLTELSRNLWWAWNPQIIKLFRDLDPETFRASNHNPISVLAGFSTERFETIADDAVLRARVDSAYRELGDYLALAEDLGRGPRRSAARAAGRLPLGRVRHPRVAADLQRRPGRPGGRPPQERLRPRAAAGGGRPVLSRVLLPPEARSRTGSSTPSTCARPPELLPAEPARTPGGTPADHRGAAGARDAAGAGLGDQGRAQPPAAAGHRRRRQLRREPAAGRAPLLRRPARSASGRSCCWAWAASARCAPPASTGACCT